MCLKYNGFYFRSLIDVSLVFVSIAAALSTVESDAVHAAEEAHKPGEF